MADPTSRSVLPGNPGVVWHPWGAYSDVLLDRAQPGSARAAITRPP